MTCEHASGLDSGHSSSLGRKRRLIYIAILNGQSWIRHLTSKTTYQTHSLNIICFRAYRAVCSIAVCECRLTCSICGIIVYFTNKTTTISHSFNLVVFGSALFKCSASGITHNASRTVIIVVALALQWRIHHRAVFDGWAITHTCNTAHITVVILTDCHKVCVFYVKIFNRAESNPPENASRSETIWVYFSGRNWIYYAVTVTIIISRKIVTPRITNRFPRYTCQVNVSSLLEVIAIAVSNTCGLSIKRFCIARV